jgi:hypothetical protein
MAGDHAPTNVNKQLRGVPHCNQEILSSHGVHISAVERAGLSTLNEGQQLEYEIEENRGKTSAVNLRVK